MAQPFILRAVNGVERIFTCESNLATRRKAQAVSRQKGHNPRKRETGIATGLEEDGHVWRELIAGDLTDPETRTRLMQVLQEAHQDGNIHRGQNQTLLYLRTHFYLFNFNGWARWYKATQCNCRAGKLPQLKRPMQHIITKGRSDRVQISISSGSSSSQN